MAPKLLELHPTHDENTGWTWAESSPLPSPTLPDGKPWPRVSIVTPSYNQAQFLEETIRSVLLQNYPNLEYFIIDGGSTDGSVEIIKKYAPWLAYWVSEPDRGQSHAINKGYARATGEIVGWLNSDDIYYPRAICEAVKALTEASNANLVYSDCLFIDRNSNPIRLFESKPLTIEDLISGNCIPQATVFFRKCIFDDVGYLNEQYHYAMDYDLWVRVSMSQPVEYIKAKWAGFRLSNINKSIVSPEKFWPEVLQTQKMVFDTTEDNHLKNIARNGIRKSIINTILYSENDLSDSFLQIYLMNHNLNVRLSPKDVNDIAEHYFNEIIIHKGEDKSTTLASQTKKLRKYRIVIPEVKKLRADLNMILAFHLFEMKEWDQVIKYGVSAILSSLSLMNNRGLISVIIRSLWHLIS